MKEKKNEQKITKKYFVYYFQGHLEDNEAINIFGSLSLLKLNLLKKKWRENQV